MLNLTFEILAQNIMLIKGDFTRRDSCALKYPGTFSQRKSFHVIDEEKKQGFFKLLFQRFYLHCNILEF